MKIILQLIKWDWETFSILLSFPCSLWPYLVVMKWEKELRAGLMSMQNNVLEEHDTNWHHFDH